MYPYLLMVLVVMMYAGNILTGKAINELPPFTIAFFRLLIAFLVLLPIGGRSLIRERSVFLAHKKPFLMMTLTGVTFFNTFIYGALQFTTATNVAVLETVIPVVTVLLSFLILKEKLQKLQWLGIFLSFIGAVWVVMDGEVFKLTSFQWNAGDGIMIGAILSWAYYSIVVKQYMHLFPAYGAILAMTSVSLIVLVPFVAIEWVLTGIPTLSKPEHVMGFLYLGIFPSFIALVFYNRAVEWLGPAKASIFLNFLPVVTMVGAYFWLGERIGIMEVLGALMVIIGVLMTTQLRLKRRSRKSISA